MAVIVGMPCLACRTLFMAVIVQERWRSERPDLDTMGARGRGPRAVGH
jgi:hypothetical protein